MMLSITVPIRTVNELNASKWNRFRRSKMRASQRQHVSLAIMAASKTPPALPVVVRLVRLSPGTLSRHDGLPVALKAVRDAVADYLIAEKTQGTTIVRRGGTRESRRWADDDDPRITWEYDQERSRHYAVRIEIEPRFHP